MASFCSMMGRRFRGRAHVILGYSCYLRGGFSVPNVRADVVIVYN